MTTGRTELYQTIRFLRQYASEENRPEVWLARRLAQVRREVLTHGTYTQTPAELTFGGRVAWRNSARCIGRFYWRSLRVVDQRHARTAAQVFEGLVDHLLLSTNRGRIRPVLSIFPPGCRIVNSQLIRYAGYPLENESVLGDPVNVGLTSQALRLGWRGQGTAFDILPIIIEVPGEAPQAFTIPAHAILEVPLAHADFPWFAELGLKWHALPAIANHVFSCGGIEYTCAPFSGWYMGTEIGARNLADADRYDLLPVVAERLGLDTSHDRTLWKDHALLIVNEAVLQSFDAAGVTVVDHHTEARRFMEHLGREEKTGRRVPADWSWIVPPMSGSTTPVFHRYYDEPADERPAFLPPSAGLSLERPAFAGH
jgi:nitric-oxide synthase